MPKNNYNGRYKLVPVRKVHFLSFRPKGEILNANTINRIRFFATLEMTVLPNFRTGTKLNDSTFGLEVNV